MLHFKIKKMKTIRYVLVMLLAVTAFGCEDEMITRGGGDDDDEPIVTPPPPPPPRQQSVPLDSLEVI